MCELYMHNGWSFYSASGDLPFPAFPFDSSCWRWVSCVSSALTWTPQVTLNSGYWKEEGGVCRLWKARGRKGGRAGGDGECSLIVLPCSLVTAEGHSHPSLCHPAAPTWQMKHLWLTSYQLSFYTTSLNMQERAPYMLHKKAPAHTPSLTLESTHFL